MNNKYLIILGLVVAAIIGAAVIYNMNTSGTVDTNTSSHGHDH